MPPSDDWRAALAAVADAPVTVVIGASDAGKTTLVAALAGELASRDTPVGVVDSDVGQSEIGPPTTVGLGRISAPVSRLAEATPVAFHFVGVSSPARDIAGVVEATRRMTVLAQTAHFERILIDTSGLVAGWPGTLLKQRKIAAVDADLLLVLERGDECAPILERYEGRSRPRVLRLAARGRPWSRSQTVRRRHRALAFERYLRGARILELTRSAITLQTPRGIDALDAVGALCGLEDAQGRTLALGVVEDVSAMRLTVRAPSSRADAVAALRIGRERSDGTPLAPAPDRRTSTPVGDGRDGAS